MTGIQDDDEDWVTTAMADDYAVAELLTLFRRAPPPEKKNDFLSPPPLEWTVRQPRSKATARASPTTPLSWTTAAAAATSASGDASVDSNRHPKLHHAARSMVTAASGINVNKKSKKKRTITELRQEEICLAFEREQLKRQLETCRFTLENQRAMNESLKRYKIDVLSQPPLERVQVCHSIKGIPNKMQLLNASFAISTEDIRNEDCEALKRLPSKVENSSENFVLPDLNIPFDEHSNIELL